MSQSLDDRTGYLLKQYIAGACTYDEFNELLALVKIQADDNVLQQLLLEEVRISGLHQAGEQVNWGSMLQTILQQRAEEAKAAPVRKMVWFKRMAVAAVLVVCIGAIAYWWLQKDNSKHPILPTPTLATNIMPGRNGAVLTLHNGQQVVLDSAQNGALTTLPDLHIVKHDSLIAYSTAKEAKGETAYNTLTTPRGRQFQVVLSDGTKVWLNASSSIHYPAVFNGKERVVDVTGEVYFEVAKNAAKPFIVNILPGSGSTARGRVEVLGTHFNINAYDDEPAIKTTLLEGSVKVTPPSPKGESAVLKPGEQASISHLSQKSHPIPVLTVETEEVMAWKNGLFQYKAADIETVLRQAARWYDVQFEFKENISERFSGQISRSANLDQLLKILELTGKVRFEIQGKTIVVKR